MKTLFTSSRYLPHYRTINTIAHITKFMKQLDIPIVQVLEGSGIEQRDLRDPDRRIRTEQELKILSNIRNLSSEPEIGLRIGQEYHIGVHGNLGIAVMFSDTLVEAIALCLQYAELTLTYFQYELTVNKNLAYLKMTEAIKLDGLRQMICEREFASVYRMINDVYGKPLTLNKVCIAYRKPAYSSLYSNYFKCPIEFNSKSHMFVFDSKYLSMQLPKANPLMREKYQEECRKLYTRLKDFGTVAEKVYNELEFYELSKVTMRVIADNMHISTRTLRRNLACEGTSFQSILLDVLKKKAINYLIQTDIPIDQIAENLGYSNRPNFYHAFKKWTGASPAEFRNRNIIS
ncbi:AraC family transcriptional regulator [Leptospira saintgironsiae]|uniref:HTH araC/xylS-type domain-containing protein n=1 Tax=Leptospira saintgironsiae TaxID=2023183 RepID=A0A2M9YCI6_9LEPT|nr:AraC family transcriptional regulator [Leptospira saintgironsiae]PJZ49229.1 hypothetical protein CH362_07760 [Leptospira saintgironsiae]